MDEIMGIKLCDECIRKIEEIGLHEATLEDIIADKIHIAGTFAIDLAKEGHYVMRENDVMPFTMKIVDNQPQFCVVDANYETKSYRTFTAEDLMANDYIVLK